MLEMQHFRSELQLAPSPTLTSLVKYLYYGASAIKQVSSVKECLQLCQLDEYYLLSGNLRLLAELRLKEDFLPLVNNHSSLLLSTL